MTREEREEALAIMNVIIHMIDEQYDNDRVEKAVDTAIAALKAEPCEDTISRKHLLSEIDDLMKSPWFNQYKNDIAMLHFGYIERKEAVEIVRDLCVKAEPPVIPKLTECEDAVSRQAVLDAMSDTWKHICFVARRKHPTKGEEAVYSDMCGTINRVPPVTPKQRTGKWELTDDEQNYRCSCCKNHWISASEYFDVWKYCPNCGAKMEGE